LSWSGLVDRELSFHELRRLFEAHGCTVVFRSKSQMITITRASGLDHRYWSQHAHKGQRDSYNRHVVRAARRRLGFADMGDEEFYAPLG
jgi:hypothetical protein